MVRHIDKQFTEEGNVPNNDKIQNYKISSDKLNIIKFWRECEETIALIQWWEKYKFL